MSDLRSVPRVKRNIMQRSSIGHRMRAHGVQYLMTVWVCFFASASMAAAQDVAAMLEESIIKVVEKSEPSVVSIARFKPSIIGRIQDAHSPFHREPPRNVDVQPNDFGAGCLVSPPNSSDRLVLTNYHVVRGGPVFDPILDKFEAEDKTELLVQFTDRRGCRAAIIAADPRSDLAVLRLDWAGAGIKPTDFPTLEWDTAVSPRKGQFVLLLGNPHAIARDGSASVSWGMVSNLTRQPISLNRSQEFDPDDLVKGSMLHRLGAVMQLDAKMNLGLSGGPVLNLKGELIGISTSLAAIEGYEPSVGFALPINSLTRRIIRTLLAGQEVEYGMIGIQPLSISGTEFARRNTGSPQQSAVFVNKVTHGSPAHLAKLQPGDIILKVEETPVLSSADLMRLIGLHPPGTEIDVTVWHSFARPPHQDTVRIKLGKWPVQDAEGVIETNPRYAPWRGLTVDYPTARENLRDRDESYDFRHVIVTRIKPNSPAEAARLEPGTFITHVNNIAVQTPAEFHAAVKGLSGTVTLRLHGKVVKVSE
jgi:serine protease Do